MKYTVIVNQEVKQANVSFAEANTFAKQQVATGNKVTVRRSQEGDATTVIESILNSTTRSAALRTYGLSNADYRQAYHPAN